MYLDGFETERLTIRKLSKDDSLAWKEFFRETDYFEYIGLDPSVSASEHLDGWMDRQFTRYKNNEYGLLALVDKISGELVGQCGIITMNVIKDDELEIGYHILKKYWGKGYATEAATFFRDYIFLERLANSVIAVININNDISQTVAMNLGMSKEKEMICMGKPSYLYRIDNKEWRKIL